MYYLPVCTRSNFSHQRSV